jgi:ribosomal protein L35AE/L33A
VAVAEQAIAQQSLSHSCANGLIVIALETTQGEYADTYLGNTVIIYSNRSTGHSLQ